MGHPSLVREPAVDLAADEACIEAPGQAHVGRTLHQRPPVRKQRDRVLSALETQQKPVKVDLAVRFQTALHLGKVNRTMVFMDLYRVPYVCWFMAGRAAPENAC